MKRKANNIIYVIMLTIVTFMVTLFAMSVKWFKITFGVVKFDSILFTLSTPLKGAEDAVKVWARYAVPFAAGCSVLILLICLANSKVCLTIRVRIGKKAFQCPLNIYKHKWTKFLLLLLITLCSANSVAKAMGIKEYLMLKHEKTTIYEDYYVDPERVKISFPEDKRNVIIIYMESMESLLADKEVDGQMVNLIPELQQLARRNESFYGDNELRGGYSCQGTGWTMGALMSSSSGIPFTLPVEENSMEAYDNFMPGLQTIGDILDKHGYNQEFMCGSDAKYGGRTNFFQEHGNFSVWDYYTAIQEGYITEDYFMFWGVEDQKLYEYAKNEIVRMSKEEQPFNFTMLTVDTHYPDGLLCGDYEELYSEKYANVFRYASVQAADFVTWIQQQDFYKNTTVVILGDHPSMNKEFFEEIPEEDRGTYNCFINSLAETEKLGHRDFTTLDYFPTILASMGVEIEGDRLGLGTNLFSDKQTLTEQMGREAFNTEIAKESLFFNRFLR